MVAVLSHIYIEHTCDCGQCEFLQLFSGTHAVRLNGHRVQAWTAEPSPSRYDPRCLNCIRRTHETLRILSTDGPGPTSA